MNKKLRISIIIPALNERENIEILLRELYDVLNDLDADYEVILVNDGSNDGTHELLEQLVHQYPKLIYITFKRNFGQTAALAAGFDYSKGEYLIPLDADLQNDPKDIPRLLEKAEEGFDVVSGWRKNRHDKFLRSFCSKVANKILSKILHTKIHDYGCTLKVYRAEEMQRLRLYGDMHRFIPAVAKMEGAKVTELVVNHRKRKYGESKYNFLRIRNVFLDLIAILFLTTYLKKPIRVFGRLSLWAFGIASIATFKAFFDKILYNQDITDTPFLLIGVFLYIVSLQLMAFGLLCEVQIRTYYESQGKKIYRVQEILGENCPKVSTSYALMRKAPGGRLRMN